MATYTAPPPALQAAITSASNKYGVPPDLLVGIWREESGSTYPNPAVNSSGYGGLFGTKNWNASTQDQANQAASILATGLSKYGGSVSAALSYYNSGKPTGGYTSVPGETTFGNVTPNQKWLTPAFNAQTSPLQNLTGDLTGWVSQLGEFLKAYALRVAKVVGGGVLALAGVFLLTRGSLPAAVPIPV